MGSIVNLVDYLKAIDIAESRALGVDIFSITCDPWPRKGVNTLDRNIRAWIEEYDVLKGEETESEPYGSGAGRGRQFHTTRFFSKFKIVDSNDSGIIESFVFRRLGGEEIEKYSGNQNELSYEKTPSLLQIAHGLMKKHKDIKLTIYGDIPGISEFPKAQPKQQNSR